MRKFVKARLFSAEDVYYDPLSVKNGDILMIAAKIFNSAASKDGSAANDVKIRTPSFSIENDAYVTEWASPINGVASIKILIYILSSNTTPSEIWDSVDSFGSDNSSCKITKNQSNRSFFTLCSPRA